LGDDAAARSRLEASVELCRALRDRELLARALFHLFYETGEPSEGEESVALYRQAENRMGLVYPLYCLGNRALHEGDCTRARSLYEESLALARELQNKAALARPIAGLAVLAWIQGDYVAARSLYQETVALRQEVGDTHIAYYLNALGSVLYDQGDCEGAAARFEESLALSREGGYRRALAGSLVGLGAVAGRRGDYEQARSLCEQGLVAFQELGDRWGIAQALTSLGCVAQTQGDHAGARRYYVQSLALASELGRSWGSAASLGPWNKLGIPGYIAGCLEALAGVDAAEGRPERAVQLLGAAEGLREGAGAPLPPANRDRFDCTVASARAALGEQPCARAWARGRSMSLEQVVAFATEPGAEA
jgi:tetratricopeptide (TPR) repeat protein